MDILNSVVHMDIFDLCDCLEDDSIDMILCDLPYGITACEWDNVIPLDDMWECFKRVIKPRGAVVLTASQPFTSQLVMSNLDMFKYEWVWEKSQASGHLNSKKRPMLKHEQIIIFSNSACSYYPQLAKKPVYNIRPESTKPRMTSKNYGEFTYGKHREVGLDVGYPQSIIHIPNQQQYYHPTQKPIALFEYLIRTYTQAGEVVFDPCVGSGTTALAARNTGRNYIVGDSSAEYVQVARDRLAKPYTLPMFNEAMNETKPEQMVMNLTE